MDTLPKARLFYALDSRRVSGTKTLLLSELLPEESMQLLKRQPFTRAEVMSRETIDPTTSDFVVSYTNIVSGRKSGSFRVVDEIIPYPGEPVPAGVHVGTTDSPPKAVPDDYDFPEVPEAPYAWPEVVGLKGVINDSGTLKPVMVLDGVLDIDVPPGRLVVQLAQKKAEQTAPPQELTLIAVERDAQVEYTRVEVPMIVKVGPKHIVEYPRSFSIRVKDISKLMQYGKVVALSPINNTVSAHRRGTSDVLAGILDFTEVSGNHLPSSQVGREGQIKLVVQTKNEPVTTTDPDTGVQTTTVKPVTRQYLSYNPPEMPVDQYGPPVDVSASTTGLECEFALRAAYDADDGEGGTFVKDLKLVVKVDATAFPLTALGVAEVEVRAQFWKTPDGRPILGKSTTIGVRTTAKTITETGAAGEILFDPGVSLLNGLPGWNTDEILNGQPTGASVPIPVDDQGLYLWHDPEDPLRGGLRTYPTAVFEQWFRDLLDDSGEIILQKEPEDKNLPIWIVPAGTDQLDAFLQDQAGLRPFSREPDEPDFKSYPYRNGTPRDMTFDPEKLISDVELAQLATGIEQDYEVPIQNPEVHEKPVHIHETAIFPLPKDDIPWIRKPSAVYYYFVMNQSDVTGIITSPSASFVGRARFADGPLSEVLTYPVTTQLSGTGENKPAGLTQTLLMIYPRRQVPSVAGGPQDALEELSRTCGGKSNLSPAEQQDMLDEVARLTSSQGARPKIPGR